MQVLGSYHEIGPTQVDEHQIRDLTAPLQQIQQLSAADGRRYRASLGICGIPRLLHAHVGRSCRAGRCWKDRHGTQRVQVGRRWRRRSWNGESTADRRTGGGGSFMAVEPRGKRCLSAGQHERGPKSVERANCAYMLLDHARGCCALLCRCRFHRSPSLSPIRNISNVSRLPLVRLRTCLAVQAEGQAPITRAL